MELTRPATNDCARPDGVELFDRWSRRGAADDAFRLAPPGWWLRLPDGFSDGVTIFSRGEIRPAVRTPYFPPVACGPIALPPSLELAAGETYSAEFLCEAGAESAAASDVEVVGEFIENETGRTFTSRVALTVVRVELQAKKTAPENGCRGRHAYGVDEIVRCIALPADSGLEWKSTGLGTVVASVAGSTESLYTCPLSAERNGLSAERGDVKYVPQIEVLEPTGIKCEGCDFEAADVLVGIGMILELHVLPYTVSFEELQLQEVAAPADAASPEWGVHTGFFNDFAHAQKWYHYAMWGAGSWVPVGEGNRWGTYDRSRMFSWPRPWSDGRLTWTIPVAWRSGRESSVLEQKRMKAVYASEWTMTGDAVVKRKHGMELTLTEGGMVFLNGEHMGKVDEDGVGE